MTEQTCIAALFVDENGDMGYLPPVSTEVTEEQFLAVQFLSASMDEFNDIKKGGDPYGVDDMVKT